jgi:hypothetical protein
VPDPAPSDAVWNLAAMAMLASDFGEAEDADPWTALHGFRANNQAAARVSLSHAGTTRTIEAGSELPLEGVATAQGGTVLVFSDGQAFAFTRRAQAGRRARAMPSTATYCRRCRGG